MIDVLLPARDPGPAVETAISSTLTALPRGGRILIYDDASSDGWIDKAIDGLSASGKKRCEVIRGTTKVGIAGGLNALLDASDAELVARMDADDYALPYRFHLQLHTLDRTASDVLFGSVIFATHTLRPRALDVPIAFSNEVLPAHLVMGNMLIHPTMLARREILSRERYRDVAGEDYDLWLRLASRKSCRLHRAASPVVVYRRHPSQSSLSPVRRAAWLERDGLLRSYKALCKLELDFVPDDNVAAHLITRAPGVRPTGDGAETMSRRIRERAAALGPVHRRLVLARLSRSGLPKC